jgi:ribonuclease HI
LINIDKKFIKIYTDGSCLKNGVANGGGLGGYGAILMIYDSLHSFNDLQSLKINESFFFASGYQINTTNNQMELSGAIAGLKLLTENFNSSIYLNYSSIEIYTDSQYVKNGINDWIHNWKKNNWRTAARTPVKNQNLWIELDSLNFSIKPSWHWVKGHSENIFNDLTDHIANTSATHQRALSKNEIINKISFYF